MTPPEETAALKRGRFLVEQAPLAIKATEYKYFGHYEMSDNQRQAVDTLVECAEVLPALLDLARRAEAAEKRVGELAACLAEVLPYTEAERLYEAAAVRCGKTRDPINKAVRRARALITPIAEGR